MAILFFLLSLVLQSGYADVQNASVSGTHASFKESALILSGKIRLSHDIGMLFADHAELMRGSSLSDKAPFSTIHLQNKVRLDLNKGGSLYCFDALINCDPLVAHLKAADDDLVTFIDSAGEKNGTKIHFQLAAREVELSFVTDKISEKGSELEKLSAKNDLLLLYDDFFKVEAQRGCYYKNPDKKSGKNKLKGLLVLHGKDPFTPCQIGYHQENFEADEIQVDIAKGNLAFKNVAGSSEQRTLSCSKMVWNKDSHLFSLQGNAMVEQLGVGLFKGEKLLMHYDNSLDGKLKSIESASCPTTLLSEQKQQLISPGPLKYDTTTNQVCASGLGNTQAELVKENFEFLADSITLEYSLIGTSLKPISVAAKGCVKLFFSGTNPLYARADRAHFCPHTNSIVLSALPGNYTLFLEGKTERLLCAQQIYLTQDLATKKISAKATGKIIKESSSEELAQIKADFLKIAAKDRENHRIGSPCPKKTTL